MKQNETSEEFEARMIAQFNKQVNETENTFKQKELEESFNSKSDASETGGPKGLEPTRYGDWESKGRCHDF